MAAYPSIGLQHDIKPANQRRVSISEAGTVRFVNLGDATAYTIRLTHPIINSTDRDTLLTFYTTNKNNVNTITLAGAAYNVHFLHDYEVESLSASYFTLSVTLAGVKS
jgi:hypothetical protein